MLFSVFLNNYIDPATAADTLIIILFIFTLSTILPNVLKKLKLSSFDESKPKLNARAVKVLPKNRDVNKKRTDYIGWEEYFMAMAFLAAKRSKDPVSQVGACIVNQDKQIISVGYNGMPRGCSDDLFPWAKYADNPCDTKFMYVCHAEVNAILNKNCHDLKGCTIYVALFPCNKCAIEIIQSKIKSVVYMSDKNKDKDSTRAARAMFDACGIVYRQYKSDMTKIEIDFTDIDWNKDHQMPPTPIKRS